MARRPLTDVERQAAWFVAACILLGTALGILYDLTH